MTISNSPFNGVTIGDANRIRRVTFMIGSCKTAARVLFPTGSLDRYDAARADSTEPTNRHHVPRDRYIDEEA